MSFLPGEASPGIIGSSTSEVIRASASVIIRASAPGVIGASTSGIIESSMSGITDPGSPDHQPGHNHHQLASPEHHQLRHHRLLHHCDRGRVSCSRAVSDSRLHTSPAQYRGHRDPPSAEGGPHAHGSGRTTAGKSRHTICGINARRPRATPYWR